MADALQAGGLFSCRVERAGRHAKDAVSCAGWTKNRLNHLSSAFSCAPHRILGADDGGHAPLRLLWRSRRQCPVRARRLCHGGPARERRPSHFEKPYKRNSMSINREPAKATRKFESTNGELADLMSKMGGAAKSRNPMSKKMGFRNWSVSLTRGTV